MRRIKPTLLLALALASVTMTLILTSYQLGWVPDTRRAELEARAKVAEALAVQITGAMQREDQPVIVETLAAVVERNGDVLSIAARRTDGTILVSQGDHERHWNEPGRQSTPTHIFVPFTGADGPQGRIEMAFTPLATGNFLGIPHPVLMLIGFVAGAGFLIYFFLLRKTIKQLDPGKVVPERVKRAFDTLSEGVVLMDERGRILLVNDAFAAKLGGAPKHGSNINRLGWRMPDGSAHDGGYVWHTAMRERRETRKQAIGLRTKDGVMHRLAVGATAIIGDDERLIGAIVTVGDETELSRSREDLAKTAAQLAEREMQMQRQTQELQYLTDHDTLSGCLNRRTFLSRLERLLAGTSASVTLLVVEIDGFHAIADAHGPAVTDRMVTAMGALLRDFAGEAALVARHRGEEFVIAVAADADQAEAVSQALHVRVAGASKALLPGHESVTVSVGIAQRDGEGDDAFQLLRRADLALGVRQRGVAPAAIEVADAGAAIRNERAAFEAGLDEAVTRAQRSEQPFAVLRLKLGSNEYLREALGSALTTGLLDEIARMVRASLRGQDGVLLNAEAGELTIHLGEMDSAEDVTFAVGRLAEDLRAPIAIGGRDVYVAAKVGAALFPDDGRDAETLTRHAGVALTRALEDGRLDSVRFYEASMVQASEWRMNVESGIRSALANDEFTLFFQPIVCAKTGAVAAAEGLLRCTNHQLTGVRVDQIIDVAEQSNLSEQIDEWVIRRGLAQMHEWCEADLSLPKISLNVSARQLCNEAFMDRIHAMIRNVRFSPTRVQIEVTETARVANVHDAAPHLSRLQDLGVQIALDDFGTGQASLTYLQRLHPDVLKIDKSFIEDVTVNHANATLVAGMTVMAHCLGVRVVVEGVEEEDQMNFLAETGCDEVQGYLVSKPMPTAAMTDWLGVFVRTKGAQDFVAGLEAA